MPFGGPIDSDLERLTHGRIDTGETLFEVGKTFAGFSKSWHQLLFQKHGDKWPEFQFRRVAGNSLTIGLIGNDGIEFHESSKPLTRCSGADIQSLDDLIHREGFR